MTWQQHAACRGADTGMFFLDLGDNAERASAAKAICAGCPVATECLDYAFDNNIIYGIWGGLTVQERRRLRAHDRGNSRSICGTYNAYNTHLRRGEPACAACKQAKREYNRSRRKSA